ncbi:unnamed protein product [Linum trigynum]|uniref:Uncharacterized protein n=1 Tax=Linum trigynum TaxID=586398 RepID=A0AAV2DFH0_9ROSI
MTDIFLSPHLVRLVRHHRYYLRHRLFFGIIFIFPHHSYRNIIIQSISKFIFYNLVSSLILGRWASSKTYQRASARTHSSPMDSCYDGAATFYNSTHPS